jgi:hypothetical protein
MAQGAVDSELLFSGLRRLWISGERILIVRDTERGEKNEADHPPVSQMNSPQILCDGIAAFYAKGMNFRLWKSISDGKQWHAELRSAGQPRAAVPT